MKHKEILHIFPDYMRNQWREVAKNTDGLWEIRLRVHREIILIFRGKEFFLDKEGRIISDIGKADTMDEQDMEAVLNHICDYSIYAFSDEIKQGFLTISGGHRIGIAGQVILEDDGRVRNIKHIRYMNLMK